MVKAKPVNTTEAKQRVLEAGKRSSAGAGSRIVAGERSGIASGGAVQRSSGERSGELLCCRKSL